MFHEISKLVEEKKEELIKIFIDKTNLPNNGLYVIVNPYSTSIEHIIHNKKTSKNTSELNILLQKEELNSIEYENLIKTYTGFSKVNDVNKRMYQKYIMSNNMYSFICKYEKLISNQNQIYNDLYEHIEVAFEKKYIQDRDSKIYNILSQNIFNKELKEVIYSKERVDFINNIRNNKKNIEQIIYKEIENIKEYIEKNITKEKDKLQTEIYILFNIENYHEKLKNEFIIYTTFLGMFNKKEDLKIVDNEIVGTSSLAFTLNDKKPFLKKIFRGNGIPYYLKANDLLNIYLFNSFINVFSNNLFDDQKIPFDINIKRGSLIDFQYKNLEKTIETEKIKLPIESPLQKYIKEIEEYEYYTLEEFKHYLDTIIFKTNINTKNPIYQYIKKRIDDLKYIDNKEEILKQAVNIFDKALTEIIINIINERKIQDNKKKKYKIIDILNFYFNIKGETVKLTELNNVIYNKLQNNIDDFNNEELSFLAGQIVGYMLGMANKNNNNQIPLKLYTEYIKINNIKKLRNKINYLLERYAAKSEKHKRIFKTAISLIFYNDFDIIKDKYTAGLFITENIFYKSNDKGEN